MKLELEPNAVQSPFAADLTNESFLGAEAGDHSARTDEMLKSGIAAAKEGRRDNARLLLLRVAESEPANETAWLWLASISEYPEELLVFLNNVLEVNPQNERALEWARATRALLAKTFVQRGIAAARAERKKFARQCFEQALAHDEANELAWLWLASATDAPEEKAAHLQKVLALNPENETARESLASVRRQSAQSLFKRANVAAISGDHDAARATLAELMEIAPEMDEAWILKAYLTDSHDEKTACFEKVLAYNPENETARAGLEALRAIRQRELERMAQKAEFEALLKADYESENSASTTEARENEPEAASAETCAPEIEESAHETGEAVEAADFNAETDDFEAETGEEFPLSAAAAVTDETANGDEDQSASEIDFLQDAPTQELDEGYISSPNILAAFGLPVGSATPRRETIETPAPMPEYYESASGGAAVENFQSKDDFQFEGDSAENNGGSENEAVNMTDFAAPNAPPFSDDSTEESASPAAAAELPCAAGKDETPASKEFAFVTESENEIALPCEEPFYFAEEKTAPDEEKSAAAEKELPTGVYNENNASSTEFFRSVETENRPAETFFQTADVAETETENERTPEDSAPTILTAADFFAPSVLASSTETATENFVEEDDFASFDLTAESANSTETELLPARIFSETENENFSETEAENENAIYEISLDDEPEAVENFFHAADEIEPAAYVAPQQQQPTTTTPATAPSLDAPEAMFSGPHKSAAHQVAASFDCPFCEYANEPQSFACPSCRAVLSLSDLELLLSNQETDRAALEAAVERMEAELKTRPFDADELIALGVAHLNLKNLRLGFSHLREASRMNQNNVVLGAQVNSLAIRLAEIEAQAETKSHEPASRTILVVDDSATVRKLISGKLEKCGHTVILAVDGVDALEKINETVPDLILLDITMPRMDGYQVCKLIRNNGRTKKVPVVMISGKDGFFDKVRGRMSGSTGYITKPFGPDTLMRTIEAYLN